MPRCSWCNRIIWPWQQKSIGYTMHGWCQVLVDRITLEDQDRMLEQARLRWKEEDRL